MQVSKSVPRPGPGLIIGLAVLVLAGCGGGGDTPALPAGAVAATEQPALSGTAAVDGRKRATAFTESWFDRARNFVLFDEAEAAFGTLFPGPRPTQTFGAYTYRYYPGTRNYLAVTATDIVLMGPVVGSLTAPVVYASLADFCGAPATARYCGFAERRTLMVGGMEREFIVYVPWQSRNARNLPVVFMLHGTSGTGAEFFNRSGWREQADIHGFMAVFPTALRHCFYEDDETVNGVFDANERRTPTKWAHGALGDPATMPLCTAAQIAQLPADARAKVDHPLADDIAFFDAMVSDLTQTFSIDAKRLYVSGFSNGGQMSARLAAERSTVIAAAAGNGSNAYTPLPQAARPMSFIATVGALDDRFTTPLGLTSLPMTDSGSTETFRNVFARPLADPQRLDESSYSFAATRLYGTDVSVYTYASSEAIPAAGNTLQLAIVAGLHHQYPNGDNHPMKMAELLWSFFRTQALP